MEWTLICTECKAEFDVEGKYENGEISYLANEIRCPSCGFSAEVEEDAQDNAMTLDVNRGITSKRSSGG